MQCRDIPTAFIVSVMLTRGDGTKMALHQKLLFNIYETRFVEKQWPEQLKPLWDWPEDKYPGYKVSIETVPLYRAV